jgi:hypothetical protein
MEWITNAIVWVQTNAGTLIQFFGAMAMLATITPNKSDDKFIQFVLDAINKAGLNVGRAGNKDD